MNITAISCDECGLSFALATKDMEDEEEVTCPRCASDLDVPVVEGR